MHGPEDTDSEGGETDARPAAAPRMASLLPGQRSDAEVLRALQANPYVTPLERTQSWVDVALSRLMRAGFIAFDGADLAGEACRYRLTAAGRCIASERPATGRPD